MRAHVEMKISAAVTCAIVGEPIGHESDRRLRAKQRMAQVPIRLNDAASMLVPGLVVVGRGSVSRSRFGR